MAAKFDKALNDECISAHNELRQIHGCPPIKFDPELAKSAQAYADEIARTGEMEHSPLSMDGGVGENLAMACFGGNALFSGRAATDDWYSEIEDFVFGQENQIACGHFSQVVWKSTERAGFGRSKCADGRQFIVGQYLPPGNMMNKWTENIPEPDEEKSARRRGSSSSSSSEDDSPKKGPNQPQTKGPRNKKDRLVGRSTRTRTENNVKTTIITETYQTPDGEKYEVVSETVEGSNSAPSDGAKPAPSTPVRAAVTSKPPATQKNVSEPTAQSGKPEPVTPPNKKVLPVEELRSELVDAFNKYRAKHQAKLLKRNQELEKMAQEWADYLSYSKVKPTCTYNYRNAPVGELSEVILYSGDAMSGEKVADMWYTEGQQVDYPYGKEPMGKAKLCSKFTQMLWAGSEEVGVARTTDKSGTTWFVCLFHPPGNVTGHYQENVLQPR